MIYFAQCKEKRKNEVCRILSGNVYAGNPKEAIEKVCGIIGFPLRFDESKYNKGNVYDYTQFVQITESFTDPNLAYEPIRIVDTNIENVTYHIEVAPVDEMVVSFEKEG
jgi:hypothetical protein